MMRWIDKHAGTIAVTLAIVCLFVWVMLMSGCGTEGRSPAVEPPPVGVAATLNQLGNTLAWAGGIGAAAGVALSLVALFVPALAPFAAIFRFAAIGGAGVTGTGAAAIWLSDNLWTLALGVLASVGGVLWWYWPALRRAVVARLQARDGDGRQGQLDREDVK
jgi:hypothetical protein